MHKKTSKKEILLAAREELLEKGYHLTSLRGITKKLPTKSHSSIFSHFDSKDCLVSAVMQEEYTNFFKHVENLDLIELISETLIFFEYGSVILRIGTEVIQRKKLRKEVNLFIMLFHEIILRKSDKDSSETPSTELLLTKMLGAGLLKTLSKRPTG